MKLLNKAKELIIVKKSQVKTNGILLFEVHKNPNPKSKKRNDKTKPLPKCVICCSKKLRFIK